MTFIIGTPHTHNAGYFKNDDRTAGGVLAEADIQTCTHCQCVIKMSEWKIDGAFCHKCAAPICSNCGERAVYYGCEPFQKTLDTYVKGIEKYHQILKDAGLDAPVPPPSIILPA